jgi:phosphate:Na+ symporter
LLTTFQAIGGLGLFLLGMIIMTEGLRALAGAAMRRTLIRFTRSPLTGAMTGAGTTAVLQSSSATTVATIGFVGAGLIGFPESLAIVFGADVGTTITGWLVVLIGFKLQIGTLMLPLILVGSLLRLFGSGRISSVGMAVAGFGLIFVGISMMQAGMSGLHDVVTPANFPADTLGGRFLLVLFGLALTLVTQSSSAGVAAALSALYAGAINFEQAAALVIGMDIGTTVTAVMASIGGSVGSRRTGLSHVVYNLGTGLGAFLLLTPYTLLWETLAPGQLEINAEIALVAFHTSFNLIALVVVLPFTKRFAGLMERLVPDRGPEYTRELDRSLLSEISIALTAIQGALQTQFAALLSHVNALLDGIEDANRVNLADLQGALDKTQAYVDEINLQGESGSDWNRLVAVIHSLDHLQRLHERCDEEEYRAVTATKAEALRQCVNILTKSNSLIIRCIHSAEWEKAAAAAENAAFLIQDHAEPFRSNTMERVASGALDAPSATNDLEAVRWLLRTSRHIVRITHHFRNMNTQGKTQHSHDARKES